MVSYQLSAAVSIQLKKTDWISTPKTCGWSASASSTRMAVKIYTNAALVFPGSTCFVPDIFYCLWKNQSCLSIFTETSSKSKKTLVVLLQHKVILNRLRSDNWISWPGWMSTFSLKFSGKMPMSNMY